MLEGVPPICVHSERISECNNLWLKGADEGCRSSCVVLHGHVLVARDQRAHAARSCVQVCTPAGQVQAALEGCIPH